MCAETRVESERPLIESSECRLIMMDQDKKAATTLSRLRLAELPEMRYTIIIAGVCLFSGSAHAISAHATRSVIKAICRQAMCEAQAAAISPSRRLSVYKEMRRERKNWIFIYIAQRHPPPLPLPPPLTTTSQ